MNPVYEHSVDMLDIVMVYIEDIQMFLLIMSFISLVKWTIFIFHEWRSHE